MSCQLPDVKFHDQIDVKNIVTCQHMLLNYRRVLLVSSILVFPLLLLDTLTLLACPGYTCNTSDKRQDGQVFEMLQKSEDMLDFMWKR